MKIPPPYVPRNKTERFVGVLWNYAAPAVFFFLSGVYLENPICILFFIFGLVSTIVRVDL
jgi:hypothetical protein